MTSTANDHAPVGHVITSSSLDDVNVQAVASSVVPLTAVNYAAAAYSTGFRQTATTFPPYDTDDNYFYDDDFTGAKLLIRTDGLDPASAATGSIIVGCSTGVDAAAIADEGLRQELDLFRTTRVLLVSTSLLWLPLTVANVVYATCESCRSAMTVGEVMTIKWVAYASPLVAVIASVWCSEVLRQAVWSTLTHCCSRVTGRRRQSRRGTV